MKHNMFSGFGLSLLLLIVAILLAQLVTPMPKTNHSILPPIPVTPAPQPTSVPTVITTPVPVSTAIPTPTPVPTATPTPRPKTERQVAQEKRADQLVDAAWNGRIGTLKSLLTQGADVNGQSEHGWTPLHAAIERGDSILVRFLLARGADPNLRDRDDGPSPLAHALEGGHSAGIEPDTILALIRAGADVNEKLPNGNTPLGVVAAMPEAADWLVLPKPQKSKIIRAMLARRAQINGRDKFGRTPLIQVLERYEPDTPWASSGFQFLLSHGADVDARDREGRTPLMSAVVRQQPESYDGSGLRHHIASYSLDVMKALIARGADVNAQDKSGRTPLMWAFARTNPQHDEATLKRQVAAIKLLLNNGAKINARDRRGWTPLLHAVEAYYHLPVDDPIVALTHVRLLLAHGADVKARARNGTTALKLARKEPDMEQLLTKAGAR